MRFSLPDKDLFELDMSADPPVERASFSGVGTTLFNLAVHPVSGSVYVSNLDARNHVRFEPELNGRIALNRISIVRSAGVVSVHLNPYIDASVPFSSPEERQKSLAFPLHMEFTRDGKQLFVAAFGSRAVAVLDEQARVLDRIAVGGGPSGLALDETHGRLYVMNRFDQTISVVETASRRVVATVALRYNPEPEVVRAGRPFLYDASRSGHGDSACASCHLFGDMDDLAWDLGDPSGDSLSRAARTGRRGRLRSDRAWPRLRCLA